MLGAVAGGQGGHSQEQEGHHGRLADHDQERLRPRGTIRITAVPRATRAKAVRPSHTLVISPTPVEANAPPPTVAAGLLYKGPSEMISDSF
ncbi:hypothetical protein GCM10027162_60330 [Streptomyces incanus]